MVLLDCGRDGSSAVDGGPRSGVRMRPVEGVLRGDPAVSDLGGPTGFAGDKERIRFGTGFG